METKKLLKSINIGIYIGLLVSILSFLISLVPCKKEAGIGVCKLPNPFSDLITLTDKYYLISNNPISGLMLQFIIPLLIVFIISFRLKKENKEKLVDYTKK